MEGDFILRRNMKTILALFLMATVALADGTNYGNIVTLETRNDLPTKIDNTWNPTLKQLQAVGWRKITEIEQPAAGWVVSARVVQPIDATTCRLAIRVQRRQVDIDAEAESNRLARIEWDKEQIANTIDSDPLQYAIGFYLLDCMVSNKIAATKSAAKTMVLDKAYSMINTNAP